MLYVSFSSKSKATNVFPKYLKSKAHDQSIQQRKKMFCHLIVKNYLCLVLCKFWWKSVGHGGVKPKNRHPGWLNYTVEGLSEAATGVVLKKAVFKNFAISTGSICINTCVPHLKGCNFIKKRPQYRCFPVNITKILSLTILKNICEQQFFNCFNDYLLHGPKVSRSRLYDGIRLHVWVTGLAFCF